MTAMRDGENGALTHPQKQIWVGQRLLPQCPLYNMAFAFVFPEELDPDLFLEAWRRVVEGSDALRTRLVETADGIRRESAPTPATALLNLSSRPDPAADFLRWCRKRCAHPLPLHGNLVDSVLAHLGEGRTGWYLGQHHLITDAWSTRLLYGRVAAQYEALAGKAACARALPPLPGYYPAAMAVRAKLEEVREAEHERARAHWQTRLARPGRRAPLYGRASEASGTASVRSTLQLGEERSRALEELARQEGFHSLSQDLSRFSLFAALLLAWLHRVSSQTDLGFDAPVAGRPTPEAKRSLGLFIEMFPFAAAVEPLDTLRSLGARCLEEAKLFLVNALPGLSAPSGATASNVVLNYVPGAFGPFAGARPQVEWVHPGHGDSVHDLRLQVHDFAGTGRYVLHFDIGEQALPESFRTRAVEHFEILVGALLKDPDRPIASVDLRTDGERRAAEAGIGDATAPMPERTVVEHFLACAERYPQRVALRQDGEELTFADLRERVETLAMALLRGTPRRRGLRRGERVAVVGRRSIFSVVAILAVLRARGAYVPVDPSTPAARLEYILRDSGAEIVLAGEGVETVPPVPGISVLSVADEIRPPADPVDLGPGPTLHDLAYLIYTSGSTGQPKGVLIGHHGLADYLEWAERRYVRGDRLTFPLFTSLAFDLTVTSLFLPLITGGTLEIYPEPEGPADTAVMDVARVNSVDFLKLTPSHLALLERLGLAGSRIRRMVVGGESFPARLATAVCNQLGGEVEIHNEYGPTEAVVGCVVHRYDPATDADPSVPIGGPAEHTRVEILNEAGTPVPDGVPGELWISRHGLAPGYHDRPGLTAERFLPHPTPCSPGERRYRSGDRVRSTSSGTLEFLGRLDRQLKISGFRVEPGEIEAAMLSVPGIEQCVVLAPSQASAPSLPEGQELTTQTEIRRCARCGLPSNYPGASFDAASVCGTCKTYDSVREHARVYFKTMDDLKAVFEKSRRAHTAKYDCMMLLSGGKDSTYALCRLVEMGLSVYTFTLDNGFIAEGAKENIRKVAGQLGVPVELATTPAMNAIFRDSLLRFANVCNGCFKTIYTLSMKRARELGIPIIVTGLSRGQMFETRLTEEIFRDGRRRPEDIDTAVLAARKVYHRLDDEVTRSLNSNLFEDDKIFEEVRFVDFYRYCDVGLDEVYTYLRREIPWVRPEDTGRSTNCLINDAGIYVHKRERGYHNYALPYSWDVRLGHKTRAEALVELDDDIDGDSAREILAKVGYTLGSSARTQTTPGPSFPESADPGPDLTQANPHESASNESGPSQSLTLAAFYIASEEISETELRDKLAKRLPAQLIPTHLRRVESIPLTSNGKVDEPALSQHPLGQASKRPYRAPDGPVEEYLAGIWADELRAQRIGADDHFFELGGTSLSAIQIMLRLCQEFDLDLPLDGMFSHPTLGALARFAENRILADAEEIEADFGGG